MAELLCVEKRGKRKIEINISWAHESTIKKATREIITHTGELFIASHASRFFSPLLAPLALNIPLEFFNRNVIPLNLMWCRKRKKNEASHTIFFPYFQRTKQITKSSIETPSSLTASFFESKFHELQLIYNDLNYFITFFFHRLFFFIIFLRSVYKEIRRASHHHAYELISCDVLLSHLVSFSNGEVVKEAKRN